MDHLDLLFSINLIYYELLCLRREIGGRSFLMNSRFFPNKEISMSHKSGPANYCFISYYKINSCAFSYCQVQLMVGSSCQLMLNCLQNVLAHVRYCHQNGAMANKSSHLHPHIFKATWSSVSSNGNECGELTSHAPRNRTKAIQRGTGPGGLSSTSSNASPIMDVNTQRNRLIDLATSSLCVLVNSLFPRALSQPK